jgi:hypothetical protein
MATSTADLRDMLILAFAECAWPHSEMKEPDLARHELFEVAQTLISQTDEGVYYYLPRIAIAFLDEYDEGGSLSHGIDAFVSMLNVEEGLDGERFAPTEGEDLGDEFAEDRAARRREKERLFGPLSADQVKAIYSWLRFFSENRPENVIVFEENLKYALQYWQKRQISTDS